MQTSAPAAIALARSPEKRMPPSAIAGTPLAWQTWTVFSRAVSCGTPTPATMRVVQIEPGPMPTLTASAPASTSACAPSPVAMLPAITSVRLDMRLICPTTSSTPWEWPCAVSTTMMSASASSSASARFMPSLPTPVAAATRRRPCSSLQAFGWALAFSMSFTVIRPTQR